MERPSNPSFRANTESKAFHRGEGRSGVGEKRRCRNGGRKRGMEQPGRCLLKLAVDEKAIGNRACVATTVHRAVVSCRVVSTCAEFVQASPREFNAASRLSSFLSRDCVAVHRTNVVAFALRRMTMRRRPIRAPRTHALPPYDTHFVHLSCLPRTAASTKRVRARPYSRHGACATCVNTRARAPALVGTQRRYRTA